MDDQLEAVIEQTLEGALAAAPAYMKDIENNEEMGVGDPRQFVYGMVVGMALAMGGAALSAGAGGAPTLEDQERVRDAVHARIPAVRARIFGEDP